MSLLKADRYFVEVIDNEATGKRMRALRQKWKKSVRWIAREWKLSAAYVSDLELGRRAWTDEKVAQFVNLCHKSK